LGQTGIAMINKTGYSMFWNSMWDNRIYYNRHIKEDIFLNKFFSLSFNDSFSVNMLTFKKNNFNNYKIYNYNIDLKISSFYKNVLNNNKLSYYSSKLWILKYQKWVIIYQFIYLPNLNKINENVDENNFLYKDSISYTIKYYKISSNLLNIYKKNINSHNKNIF